MMFRGKGMNHLAALAALFAASAFGGDITPAMRGRTLRTRTYPVSRERSIQMDAERTALMLRRNKKRAAERRYADLCNPTISNEQYRARNEY